MATKSRSRSRRRTKRARVTRARRSAPPKMSPAMRKKVSLGVRRYFASKKASRTTTRAVARRSSSRAAVRRGGERSTRRARRSSGGSGLFSGNPIKNLLSKDTLKMAGGAVTASVVSEWVLAKYGDKLPMAQSNQYMPTLYRAAIPLAAAYLIKKYDKKIAEGMIIGAAVMVINDVIRLTVTNTATLEGMGLAGELKGYGRMRGMGRFANMAPSPARLGALRRVQARNRPTMNGFSGTVEDLARSAGSAAFTRGAF